MRTTIDRAGRLVIPKRLRDQLGLTAGEVELVADGPALRVEPISGTGLAEDAGRLVIPADGPTVTADDVRTLRDSGQR